MNWFWVLFAFGGFWFWSLVALEVIWLLVCIARDNGRGATVSLCLSAILLALLGGPNVFRYAIDHPGRFSIFVAGYFLCGAIWSIVKWWFFVRHRRQEYDEAKAKFLLKHIGEIPAMIPDSLKQEWQKACPINLRKPPQVKHHKPDILFWMTYWPFSLVWTMIADVVTRIFEKIYCSMQKFLQGVSNRAFRGVEDDMIDPDSLHHK